MGQYKHPRKPKVKFMYTDFAGKIRLFLWETQLFPKKSRYFRQNFRRHFISRQPWFSNFHPDVLIFLGENPRSGNAAFYRVASSL